MINVLKIYCLIPEGDRTYHGLHENNEEDDDEDDIGKHTILFTAPTGKAASLLRTRSKLPSFTLHQVNFSFRYFTNRKKAKEKKKEDTSHMIWKHSNVEVLITDESSLVSVRTFSTLLDILLNHAKLQKVVLLGDVNQLPSIEPGNFMSDIFQSLERMGCSIVLRTNHRSESQLIVDNASLIAQMKMPQFNPHENFHFVRIPDLPPEVTVGSVHDSLSFGKTMVVIGKIKTAEPMHWAMVVVSCKEMDVIGHASLLFILRDVTRFVGFSRHLVQEVISLVFYPMLIYWGF